MEAELRSNILSIADAFAEHTGLALTTIGMKIVRDARFFDRMRGGKGFTVKTHDTVLRWFSDNWPADKSWPSRVCRPAPTVGAAA